MNHASTAEFLPEFDARGVRGLNLLLVCTGGGATDGLKRPGPRLGAFLFTAQSRLGPLTGLPVALAWAHEAR